MRKQTFFLVFAILVSCMMAPGVFAAGKVIVYSSNQQAQNDMMAAEFEKATGIQCEMVRAGSGILLKRIRAEKDRPLGDVAGGMDLGGLGGMLGNGSLDAIATLDFLCDDIGLDTMNTGVAIAVAMDAGYKPFGDGQAAIDLLDDMLAIREVEEMIVRLRSGGYEPLQGFAYRGPTHVSIGQEGTAVGASSVLGPTDRITSSHRGHGDAIAKGFSATT